MVRFPLWNSTGPRWSQTDVDPLGMTSITGVGCSYGKDVIMTTDRLGQSRVSDVGSEGRGRPPNPIGV